MRLTLLIFKPYQTSSRQTWVARSTPDSRDEEPVREIGSVYEIRRRPELLYVGSQSASTLMQDHTSPQHDLSDTTTVKRTSTNVAAAEEATNDCQFKVNTSIAGFKGLNCTCRYFSSMRALRTGPPPAQQLLVVVKTQSNKLSL